MNEKREIEEHECTRLFQSIFLKRKEEKGVVADG